MLLVAGVGVNTVMAQGGTKTPLLLLKNGAINSTDFDITPIAPSTLTTDNLYAATFTSKNGTSNLFQYRNLDVSAYNKAVIKYSILDANEWRVNTPTGHYALPSGTDKTYEIDLSSVDNYEDFTVFSSYQHHTVGSSITISEVYFVNKPAYIERTIKVIDYSEAGATLPGFNQHPDDVTVSITDGALTIVNPSTEGENYSLQMSIIDGLSIKAGYTYKVLITYKTEKAGYVTVALQDWNNHAKPKYGTPITVSDDFQTMTLSFDPFEEDITGFVMWQSRAVDGTISIKKVEVIEIAPEDPLFTFKEKLKAAIAKGKAQDIFAKTTESFAVLTNAIADAESALTDENATEESLTAAMTAIENAIDGFELLDGYSNLTKDMMFSWTGWDANAVKGAAFNGAYELNKPTGQPYGDASVNAFADLSSYSKLAIVSTGGTPRFLLNRDADNGQWNETESESHLIDNTKGGWSAKYFSQEGNVYTVDLAQLVSDKGFAHLHAIKAYGNVTVSGMYLYRAPDPLQPQKDDLRDKIAEAKTIYPTGKTTESFASLSDAITAGENALNASNATQESLTNATNAIENAIKGLKLVAGYTNLTANMYKKWNDNYAPTTSSAYNNPIYVVGASTGQPYGDGSVQYLNFADISEYSKLILTVSAGTPRIMMNRVEPLPEGTEGRDANGGSYVQLTPAPVEGIVEVDLTAYDYAHLNAIKGANYGNVTVNDMLLYRTVTISGAGWATFGSLDKTANLSGATSVYGAKIEGGVVKLIKVDSKNVPAGAGVLVEGTGEIVPNFDDEAAAIEGNELKVSNGTVSGEGIYVLASKNKGLGFYKLAPDAKVPAGKAYLQVANGSREYIAIDGGATAIKSVETEKANGAVYNLAGQQVKNAQKGIFIMNGKKVIK